VRSPDLLPFGWRYRYFFLAAFFAAFFAGAFLAGAFLVAICLFSLLTICVSSLQFSIAVEECIESRVASVKRKTHEQWKKGQQFFRTRNCVTLLSTQNM
jgi:hypothetical protein